MRTARTEMVTKAMAASREPAYSDGDPLQSEELHSQYLTLIRAVPVRSMQRSPFPVESAEAQLLTMRLSDSTEHRNNR